MKIALLWTLHVVIYLGLALSMPPTLEVWPFVLAVLLIWVSVVDFDRLEIPDTASALLVLSGAAWLWSEPTSALTDHLVGAIVWPLLAGGLALGYARARGWQGLGFGDVKLLCGIGIWAGFTATVWIVLAASLAGIAILVVLAIVRRSRLENMALSAVAFGPLLCLSTWAVMLQGDFGS